MVEIEKSIINDSPTTIPFDCIITLTEQMKRGICKIKLGEKQGTVFFCKIPFPNMDNMLPVFITNHHLLNEQILNKENQKIQIQIKEDQKEKEIKINNRKKYTNKEYDISIIEIKEEDEIKSFLELDNKIINNIINEDNENDKFINETIYLLQYPEGKLSVSFGVLTKIYYDKTFNFLHNCCTKEGSSGSPIINLNNKVIGINIKGFGNKYNLGTFLNYPIKEFINQNHKHIIETIPKINKSRIVEDIKLEKIEIQGPGIKYEKALLQKDVLNSQKILIIMLWSKDLDPYENEFIDKKYINYPSPESEACLKDALDYLGIIIDIVENYRDAIEKITSKDENGNCPYYAAWIINGPPYDELPDGSKEGFLLGQFLEVIKLFWENGGALIFLTGGNLYYQTNEFLKMLEFDGKKLEFYLVGDDEEKETKTHIGGQYLSGDETGLLKYKQQFIKKINIYNDIPRLKLDHNLFNLYEGENLCYTNTDDFDKLLPFHPFSRDSENGINSLFYLSDEKGRGDIFIDCGFTKLFKNMEKDDSAFRYFQNIASWSARPEIHLSHDGIDAKDWRPKCINYNIDINKKWTKFMEKTIDLSKYKTLFVFDNSGSISGDSIYFNKIDEVIKKYYKEGDKFYLWGTTYIEKSKTEIEAWINEKKGYEGTYPSNIIKIAKECPDYRDHLIIFTDGSVDESTIQECDQLLLSNKIQFKFVSVYMVEYCGLDSSVGAPFCRYSPHRTFYITRKNEIIEGPSLTFNELILFDKITNIKTINQFNNLYNKLYSVIKAKTLGRNEDNYLKNKLNILKSNIIGKLNEQQKKEFLLKFENLYEMSTKGFHSFTFEKGKK